MKRFLNLTKYYLVHYNKGENMPKNLGSIDFGEFKKIITQQIVDAVDTLSEEEKEKLISRLEQRVEESKDKIWRTHNDSAGNVILSSYPDDVNIILPDEIDGVSYEISGVTFRGKSIESIIISKGVTLIARLAFAHCDKLKKVTFADDFSGTIMCFAFMGCSSLEEFAFPSNINTVEPIVTRCQSLETVYIPSSVKKINAYALSENENLKNIHFNGTKREWNEIEKGYRWSYGMGDYIVYCLDGKIKIRKKVRKDPSPKKETAKSAYTVKQDVIMEQEDNEYIYCEVEFEETSRKYSYITNDESIQVGDMVIVPTGLANLESLAVVCSIKRCTAKNAPYPPSRTKKILRKYIQE